MTGLIDHRTCQHVHQCYAKSYLFRKSASAKPVIQKAHRYRDPCNADCDYIIAHFYKRQQIGQQDYRTVQAIIRKIINILSTAKIGCKLRKQFSCIIELLSEIIRDHAMLTDPVYLCPKHAISSHKEPADKYGQQA